MKRRDFLRTGGTLLAGAALAPGAVFATQATVIKMISKNVGAAVTFDPIGLYLAEVGQTVRWHCVSGVHTTTAYHPDNGEHSLRIPENAEPWDSGYLQVGDTFEYTFTVPGVYDYFCLPHELAGMVGRIIVADVSGPGAKPFDYFKDEPGTKDWQPVPAAAQKNFPSIEAIMQQHRISAQDDAA
ncbi:MAG TPA: plastocyanin/azurin family copper-binding protein [Salinisphaeraceae bacterium]|nr:plastocyanin/azurin family copper-binding protein [Salinisphaeraceae bacterium]